MRRIIVMESHEWLEEASAVGNFAVASQALDSIGPPGVQYADAPPVKLDGDFVLAADIDGDAESEMLDTGLAKAVFADPQIAPFPVAPSSPVGTIDDVADALELESLRDAGALGRGVRVAVVDSGVDGTQVNVSGGASLWPGTSPGTAPPGHGTMCALDVQIAAPDAQIHDYPLLRSDGNTWIALLSDAIRVFAEIMTTMLRLPGPMVVTNSWGMYDTVGDEPLGSPQNYSGNDAHPFNTITAALVAAGADVMFAAGNCGADDPTEGCGQNDIGPGRSILGANGHPDVITVGAVTVEDAYLGYSSQGPALLSHEKPDVVSYSHFDAPGSNPSFHSGTSAACPVAAGVVAALRSKPSASALPPGAIKRALIDGATSPSGHGWTPDLGRGIVRAGATWHRV